MNAKLFIPILFILGCGQLLTCNGSYRLQERLEECEIGYYVQNGYIIKTASGDCSHRIQLFDSSGKFVEELITAQRTFYLVLNDLYSITIMYPTSDTTDLYFIGWKDVFYNQIDHLGPYTLRHDFEMKESYMDVEYEYIYGSVDDISINKKGIVSVFENGEVALTLKLNELSFYNDLLFGKIRQPQSDTITIAQLQITNERSFFKTFFRSLSAMASVEIR